MLSILITGGAGFGGAGLTKALLERGHKVTVFDITAPNHADALREEINKRYIKYLWKAVHDMNPKDIEGCDVVCHFAAQADVPMGFSSSFWTGWENVMGTIKVLETVRTVGIKKFILASSGNVYGRPLRLPIDENHPLTPHNPYAASKASQELYCWAYHRCYGIPLVVFRNGIVYGPGMRREIFIYKWLKELLLGHPIWVEGGEQTRDPCFVGETIEAWLKGVEAPAEKVVGEAFQISAGREYKVAEIAVKCVQAMGFSPAKKIGYRDYRPGEQGQRECFDISKAKRVLGYSPRIDLDTGIRLTLKWMREEGHI